MAYIYKITNKLNNKIYIGQTIRTVEKRWKQHLYCYERLNSNNYLYNAMKKHGVENFTIEELEECKDEDRFKRETCYIIKYNSMYPNGYNLILSQNSSDYPLELIELMLNDWDNGFCFNEIAKKWKLNEKTVSEYLKKHGISEEQILKRKADIVQIHCSKKVYHYTINGILIDEWWSASEVERVLNLNRATISKCCTGKILTAFGDIWLYDKDCLKERLEKIKKVNKIGRNKKEILQLNEKGDVINIYESASAAGRAFGKSHAGIASAARRNGIAYGFYWKYRE